MPSAVAEYGARWCCITMHEISFEDLVRWLRYSTAVDRLGRDYGKLLYDTHNAAPLGWLLPIIFTRIQPVIKCTQLLMIVLVSRQLGSFLSIHESAFHIKTIMYDTAKYNTIAVRAMMQNKHDYCMLAFWVGNSLLFSSAAHILTLVQLHDVKDIYEKWRKQSIFLCPSWLLFWLQLKFQLLNKSSILLHFHSHFCKQEVMKEMLGNHEQNYYWKWDVGQVLLTIFNFRISNNTLKIEMNQPRLKLELTIFCQPKTNLEFSRLTSAPFIVYTCTLGYEPCY